MTLPKRYTELIPKRMLFGLMDTDYGHAFEIFDESSQKI